nr:SRPBCC family protein [Sphingomonas bacterium]
MAPARWWSSAHSWSGSGANMTLDPRPGGCFRERLPGGGGVEHLRVVSAAPGTSLRTTGALGPLQGEALTGVMTLTLKAGGAGTSVTLRYAVAARRTGGTALAPAVDAALAEQVARLKTAAGHR